MRSTRSRLFGRVEPPPDGTHADPVGFTDVRFIGGDTGQGPIRFFGDLPARLPAGDEGGLKVLALSGGGAGGAFGAGALVGLTRSGARPVFDVVTGVSTGALIAPFAFLGGAWDDRLTDAYCGGGAANLMGLRALRPGLSLYSSEPLSLLVRRHMDTELLQAVGQAHRDGRRLFIATANLDTQSTSIWDMGAIAVHADGEAALRLFTDVMIASASLPGLFPPRMIAVESLGQGFEEMHVDGGAITPLFVVPEALLVHRAQDWGPSSVEIYALINTTLEPRPESTSMGAVSILVRSFELMLRSSYRSALRSVSAFCELNDFALQTAAIPIDPGNGNLLRFDTETLSRMFAQGAELAESGRLWSKVR